jgi:hypothetical protein
MTGFFLKDRSGVAPFDINHATPQLSVYLSDPRASASITLLVVSKRDQKDLGPVEIPGQPGKFVSEPSNKVDDLVLHLKIYPPASNPKENVTFMVISEIPGAGANSGSSRIMVHDGANSTAKARIETMYLGNVKELNILTKENGPDARGVEIGHTTIPHVVNLQNGEMFAALPSIDEPVSLRPYVAIKWPNLPTRLADSYSPDALFEHGPQDSGLPAFVINPGTTREPTKSDPVFNSGTRSPLFPQFTPGGDWAMFVPQNLTTSMILAGVQADLQGDRIDYLNPGTGEVGQGFVSWTSGPILSPSIRASNIDAEDSRNNYAFYAGIAFAVAATAAFALIQEGPPRFRQKPKTSKLKWTP